MWKTRTWNKIIRFIEFETILNKIEGNCYGYQVLRQMHDSISRENNIANLISIDPEE